jgi:hypothetical protein
MQLGNVRLSKYDHNHTREMAESFPAHVYVQVFERNRIPPDYAVVVDEMKSKGIPVTTKTTEDWLANKVKITKNDLVVGNFDWTRMALKQLGIPMPQPPDYPECLKHLLHRKVWQTTLEEIWKFLNNPENKGIQVFIKPAADAKAFAAIVEPKDQMIDTLLYGIPDLMPAQPADLPVHCSEIVEMLTEFRVYIVNGEIRCVAQYRGPKDGSVPALDMSVVEEAVTLFCTGDEGKEYSAGCGMDFAVLKKGDEFVTALVEVNDGYSLGRYEGLSGKDYTDLLVARWAKVVQNA